MYRMVKVLIIAMVCLATLAAAPSQLLAAVDDAGAGAPTWSECANCSEGQWYGRTAHYWHGSEGCLPGGEGCAECDSPHCDDPSVPHEGPCPGACGQMAALDHLDLEPGWLIEELTTAGTALRYDRRTRLITARDCAGAVFISVMVADSLAEALALLVEQ